MLARTCRLGKHWGGGGAGYPRLKQKRCVSYMKGSGGWGFDLNRKLESK